MLRKRSFSWIDNWQAKNHKDLVGKKVGVPFVSTTHFHLLFALEVNKVNPKDVDILNIQPPAIAAAWARGDIDAAFVWDPALGTIQETGKTLVTSGELSAKLRLLLMVF